MYRLLDLFCGAGGAAMGYHRAGFEVVGVDIAPQPRYPFAFVQGDALEYCATHGAEFDAIHASPPCQGYSRCRAMPGRAESAAAYPQLVAEARELLWSLGRPYIIENVVGSKLECPICLCGTMFGLRVFRHRLFESSILLLQPPHSTHRERIKPAGQGKLLNVCTRTVGAMATVAGNMYTLPVGQVAMGIDWMQKAELSQAIPPAYTEFIGKQLLAYLERKAVAAAEETP